MVVGGCDVMPPPANHGAPRTILPNSDSDRLQAPEHR
ncbi:hypothetical protein E2C01_053324 [Portunus trituberculatus]|uniref:Uncharacterized protein n=1 Tax=Portunus trituberculatus TaxID=210409 RepID=A0A5B7GQH3_PORTR|nr:hypothetical protein [Portunus trituberculatus]